MKIHYARSRNEGDKRQCPTTIFKKFFPKTSAATREKVQLIHLEGYETIPAQRKPDHIDGPKQDRHPHSVFYAVSAYLFNESYQKLRRIKAQSRSIDHNNNEVGTNRDIEPPHIDASVSLQHQKAISNKSENTKPIAYTIEIQHNAHQIPNAVTPCTLDPSLYYKITQQGIDRLLREKFPHTNSTGIQKYQEWMVKAVQTNTLSTELLFSKIRDDARLRRRGWHNFFAELKLPGFKPGRTQKAKDLYKALDEGKIESFNDLKTYLNTI